jgi:hypothetical protein
MQDMVTNEATTCCKEQVSIGTGQTRERVECNTINGDENWSGKARLREELNPMNIVVVRHGVLY